LEALRFQPAPGALREDWIYQVPRRLDGIAIESPHTPGDSGFRIIARADGSGEVVRSDALYKHIRKLEQERPAALDMK
jgi:hypothetical protein